MPHTDEIEYGSLLPTPNTCDANNANNKDNHDVERGYLRGYATMGLLPTPNSSPREVTEEQTMKRKEIYGGETRGMYLEHYAVMGLLPTPTASAIGEGQSNHQLHISKDGVAKPIRESGMKGNSNLYATLQVRGLIPTPTAFDYNTPRKPETFKKAQERHKAKGVNLQNPLKQMAAMGMLPTPIAGDWKGQLRSDGTASMLSGKASLGLLPTPQAQEGEKITGKENQDSMTKRVREITGTTSQLNPRFVGEMMGFPPHWTELPFQNGGTNQ